MDVCLRHLEEIGIWWLTTSSPRVFLIGKLMHHQACSKVLSSVMATMEFVFMMWKSPPRSLRSFSQIHIIASSIRCASVFDREMDERVQSRLELCSPFLLPRCISLHTYLTSQ